jgi:hypothetical protein
LPPVTLRASFQTRRRRSTRFWGTNRPRQMNSGSSDSARRVRTVACPRRAQPKGESDLSTLGVPVLTPPWMAKWPDRVYVCMREASAWSP